MAGFIREHIIKRFTRSSKWSKVRKKHLKRYSSCAVCRKKKGLQVHHIIPFHIRPEFELSSKNLITLCAKHHLIFGHLGWWKAFNERVRIDCVIWREKYMRRPS